AHFHGEKQTTTAELHAPLSQSLARDVCLGKMPAQSQLIHKFARVIGEITLPPRAADLPPGRAGGLLEGFRVQPPHDGAALAGPCRCADDLAGFRMARPMPIDVGFVSRRFAMIYVVDAKFFESTARDADRCGEAPPGVVRDGARVKSPEPVMRRLPRRKVK